MGKKSLPQQWKPRQNTKRRKEGPGLRCPFSIKSPSQIRINYPKREAGKRKREKEGKVKAGGREQRSEAGGGEKGKAEGEREGKGKKHPE